MMEDIDIIKQLMAGNHLEKDEQLRAEQLLKGLDISLRTRVPFYGTLKVRYDHEDFWGRKLYRNVIKEHRVYADVDGTLHTYTDDGEPDCPIRNKIEFEEVFLVKYKATDTIEGYVNTEDEFKQWLRKHNKKRKLYDELEEDESEFELIKLNRMWSW